MADLYFYVWEFVTSVTIIILVAAYIINDQLKIRYEKLGEKEKNAKLHRLGVRMRIALGTMATLGGAAWFYYIQTHTLFITKELEGPHNYYPAIIMSVIGLIVLATGIKKRYQVN